MALTPIKQVRVICGDTEGSPFYQMLSDGEVQFFLDINGQNVMAAARQAAVSISLQLAGWTSRERSGDLEVWSNLSTAYLKALENLINDSNPNTLPNGLMPYASGISVSDMKANNSNPDNVRSPLTKVKVCDTPIISGGFTIEPSCGC